MMRFVIYFLGKCMVWKAAVNLSQLQQNNRQTLTIEGNKILFIWHDEKVQAVQAQCPHLNWPLAKGKINENCEIVCPFHKSAFDLKTGATTCWSPWPPAIGPLLGKITKPHDLRVYPTRVDDDQIFVNVG